MESKPNIRYLIKATYLEGPHEGSTYLLRKGGFVTDSSRCEWNDTTYSTKAIAERRCRELKKNNTIDRDMERRDEARRIQKGNKPKDWYIYYYESYEPCEIEII